VGENVVNRYGYPLKGERVKKGGSSCQGESLQSRYHRRTGAGTEGRRERKRVIQEYSGKETMVSLVEKEKKLARSDS